MARTKPPTHLEHAPPACEAALGRAFGLLGKRWNGLVVAVLGAEPLGFAELRRRIGPISDSVLSDRLAELAEAGVIERTVTDTRPPGVRYGLTPAGEALLPILEQIAVWAGDHLD
ncbi:transcriptional regulator [Streptomyces sp. 8K308]|uniref:winged helix-turn-helix transcriptional regulator n=1 Tax=Streptomyces sp. 8K308 TaxID=2530388 RepID=UPI001043DFA4|nr:helix-turn-helix domain-containing protein [Streptomyces sp. 8K308]TDC22540.1 transcriptional regulator [Streptomyces sp. 8K308]